MPYPIGLVNLSAADLAAKAGGDPWKINDQLQTGKPGAINDLADAFHLAAMCVHEVHGDFASAKQKFELGFRRNESEHPINDSAEVARATQQMNLQYAQLATIAVDLESVAAALAHAQLNSDVDIGTLNANLNVIDDHISKAKADGKDAQPLYDEAANLTKETLKAVTENRDGYKAVLADSVTAMRQDGYDPAALAGLEGDGRQSTADHDKGAVAKYDDEQRAKDQALVNSPGPQTPEKVAAAARLRDDALVSNAAADPMARHLASERLDDFNNSRLVGPLPIDPMLGDDARSRAKMRLEMQQKLESGLFGRPGMSADQATQMLDNAEQQARIITTQQAIKALESQGLSADGARRAVDEMAAGKSWKDVVGTSSTFTGAAASGADAARRTIESSLGKVPYFAESDVKALEGISNKLTVAGVGIDSAVGLYDVFVNHAPAWQTAGEVAGTAAGGYAAGVLAWAAFGETVGPEGALAAGFVASIFLSDFGKNVVGGWFGKLDGH